MREVHFTKMSGAGNDFIVIDNRDGVIAADGRRELFAQWCRRRLGVGADGVLLVEPAADGSADFRMRYYNANGGEADMCGNGARCIARFAHMIGAAPESMTFVNDAGVYRATMTGDDVILFMPDPDSLERDVAIDVDGIAGGKVDTINTGVAHVVTFVDDLAATPLDDLAPKVRYHPAFAPDGMNVNFVQALPGGSLAMRTYERGVEGETLACGTGAVAVALIANLRGLASPPVSIVTSGGPVLKIHFDAPDDPATGRWTNVRLEGEARIVYEGVLAGTPNAALARP